MKGFIAPLITLFSLTAFAQDNCSRYYPFKEDIKYEIRSFGRDDKLIAITQYQINDVWHTTTGDKALITAFVQDGTDNTGGHPALELQCSNNAITINYKSVVPGFLLEKYANLDYEVVHSDMVIPNQLDEGEELPDAEIEMNVSVAPIIMNVKYKMTNREVGEMETLSTPAGVFKCKVITYDTQFENGFKAQGTAKQGIAEGVGLVKQIDYDHNGKVAGMNLLTRFAQ